ncbi:MAG: TlpA family protein disulfide reductase [Burkholderiaceae bacterium]|nr:TlpA family protein disulfide reductase [Burkholderiaceae bacterium]
MNRRRLLVAVPLLALGARASAAEIKRWRGKPAAPPIALLDVDGAPVSLQQFLGKVVLVNFWATWCEPCIAEMPSMQKLRDRLAAEGFEVLAINYQEGPARIAAFMQKLNLSFPIVRDTDGQVARQWGARVFPASYLVNRSGTIRYAINGSADWTSPSLVSTIRTLLAAQPSR